MNDGLFTSMHIEVKLLTGSTSSKFLTTRFSVAVLRFLGSDGFFLKGSTPEDLAHVWQRNPGPGSAATVYFDTVNFFPHSEQFWNVPIGGVSPVIPFRIPFEGAL